ncbi:integrase [Pseudomonas japonica]|uniref:integrase n=1 Tax=Pseudomonas japonica TaxID=256466 RepID=UPI0015E3D434|nr:integrase [Pseudomonas japonica]MBA1245712.1 integrase [Pseudomonas japonica]
MNLPPNLEFLKKFTQDPRDAYRSAAWLKSDFEDTKWYYNFGHTESPYINWCVKLSDGSMLTGESNKILLESFKYYLIGATRDAHSNETTVKEMQAKRFSTACCVIDYFLINCARYKIYKHKLGELTSGNLKEILENISRNPEVCESIYNWTNELRRYCLELLTSTCTKKIEETLKLKPQLMDITDEQLCNNSLGIDETLIPKIRACLLLHGFYHKTANGNQPNSTLISKEIYKNCIWGNTSLKPVKLILTYNDNSCLFEREYPRAPIRKDNEALLGMSGYASYRHAIYSLGILHEVGYPAPASSALIEAERFQPALSNRGRFQTLPSELAFTSIRNAIELHIKHGNTLIDAMCRIARECQRVNIKPASLSSKRVRQLVGSELVDLGVSRLSLSIPDEDHDYSTPFKGGKSEYFRDLRANRGFYELICVYIGGIQLLVGILMARRVSELTGLMPHDCMDVTESWLIFQNAKSTRYASGKRLIEARPIDPIAAQMVKNLQRMHGELKRIGFIKREMKLFSTPHLRGAAKLTDRNFNRNLDFFCDYFETPLTSEGKRMYIRQHQLRRFFAMLFFYCSTFNSLDTLRWMLGHTDPSHVWHYITETTDGAILRSASSQYLSERLKSGDYSEYEDLAELVKDHYGTDDVEVIDSNAIEDYINDLMIEGWLEVEPEFFTDVHGETYKIVAKLTKPRSV